MKLSSLFIKITVFLLSIVVITNTTYAISISPIPIEFKSLNRVVKVNLVATAEEEKSKVFETKVYKWNVKTNEYSETNDLFVYPTASKLPAVFKIAIRNKNLNRDVEHTYRIVLRDITKNETDSIYFAMSYDIPIFVVPSTSKGGDVEVICNNDSVLVKNNTNRTVKVNEVDDKAVVMYIAANDEKTIQAKSININEKKYCKEVQ